MGPFLFLNAALVGFFGFAAIYHLILWWSSRREILLAVFSADCAVRALFIGVLLTMATATATGEAQIALRARIAFGILMMVTWVWSLSLISEVRANWFAWLITIIFLFLFPLHVFVVPLNATVTSVEPRALPWGEISSSYKLAFPGWWLGPLYGVVMSIELFGIYCGLRLWKRDRITGALVLLATCAVLALHVVHFLRTWDILDIPFFGLIGHVFWASMIGLVIARRNYQMREQLVTSEERLRISHQRLEVLSRQLISTQEAERRHLARELHDEIGQTLTAIKMNLRRTQRTADVRLQSDLEGNVQMVDQAIVQVRNLSLSLRPPQLDELGLVAALHWLVKQQARLGGFNDQMDVNIGNIQIPADLETVCFRIAQEALTNAIRHGEPRNIYVKLWTGNNDLNLSIHDDGIGFDVGDSRLRALEGDNFGLISMQERGSLVGGHVEIESTKGLGTRIHVCFPFKTQSGFKEGKVAS